MTSRRGVALLTALAMIVLISIAALERSAAARPQRLSVAAVADRAVLEAVATGGLEHARARLLELLAAGPMRSVRDPSRALDAWLPAEGMVLSDDSGELQYRVEVHDAGARLNLNAASQEQFRKLLLALRVDTRRADHLAAAFADWRDVDQLRRANGAEQPEYVEAGSAMLPDDGPFTNVGMLRFVIGMNDSLAALLRPYVTIFGSGRIDMNAAARPVLLTLPGMTEEAAALVLRYRQQGRRVTDLDAFAGELSSGARLAFRTVLPELQAAVVLETSEVHVRSEAWRRGSAARARIDAIISKGDEGRVIWRRVSP